MKDFFGILLQLFNIFLIGVALQNPIFIRAFSINIIREYNTENRRKNFIFAVFISIAVIFVSVLTYFLKFLLNKKIIKLNIMSNEYLLPLLIIILLTAAYFAMYFLLRYLLKSDRRFLKTLMVSFFNTTVLGTAILIFKDYDSFFEAVFFALGSSLGYYLALLFVSEGMRRLKRTNIPESFKGLPILLIYIGILSLAVYGLTGYSLII